MMIHYKKGNLFDFDDIKISDILVHACNAQGVWGSGIAKEFRDRYPYAFRKYNEWCDYNRKNNVRSVGRGIIIRTPCEPSVGCLITSSDYGIHRDSIPLILFNTYMAVWDMLNFLDNEDIICIKSPKINSGLFRVPWKLTGQFMNYKEKSNEISLYTV